MASDLDLLKVSKKVTNNLDLLKFSKQKIIKKTFIQVEYKNDKFINN